MGCLAIGMALLHAERACAPFPCLAEPRPTVDCRSALFWQVATPLQDRSKHPPAPVWPSAGVPLGRLHARTGGGHRAGSRGLPRASRPLLPQCPERPRLWRLCSTPPDGPQACLAAPPGLGGIDTSGMALLHPSRAGRRPPQSGRQGRAQHRWRGGGQRGLGRHQGGVVGAGAGATATVAEHPLQGLLRPCEARLMVRSARACPAAAGAPTTRTRCRRGAGEERLRVETVWSRRTVLGHGQQGRHRVWTDGHARLACTLAACKVLVQW